MSETIEFDADLIRRYDQSGPRYTSYPTAASFVETFTQDDYLDAVRRSNDDPIPAALSLYFHIPFCDTVCFYCACNKIATKNYARARDYLQYLYTEIAIQGACCDDDRIVNQLHWGGGTPTFLTRQDMRRLMQETLQHFYLRDDDKGDYSIEIDPRSVEVDDIYFLRELGFNRFSLGVQDIDDAVQKAVNRIQPIEQTREVLEACRAAGARSVNLDLIYGLPFQTVGSFSSTLDTIIAHQPDRISVFNYAHMPHIFKPQRRINADDLPAPEVKLEILKLAINKLTEAGYVYIGMDHFARPDDELVKAQQTGQLQRNFQGYTTHGDCDTVAMGVSAISQIYDVYSQNDKELLAYQAAISAGRLPVVRGVRLSKDDLLRRELIQRLTCDFAIDFKAFETQWAGLIFSKYFSQELASMHQMQEDGLLTITADRLQVLPKGRLLVRNICMKFDGRLPERDHATRFSRVI